GGSVSAESGGVGQGSQFTVRLPLLEGARTPVEEPEAVESVRSGTRVLVVDDNHDTADSVGMLLESAGFATRVAYDGIAALEEAEAFRPEVVLLDIGLPGLDGYQVAERLRGDPRADGVKLIA